MLDIFVIPCIIQHVRCGCSSSGRAPPCQGGGSECEPRHPLHKSRCESICFFLCPFRLEHSNPTCRWQVGHRRSRRRCFLMRCPLDTEVSSLVTRSIKDHTIVWSFFFMFLGSNNYMQLSGGQLLDSGWTETAKGRLAPSLRLSKNLVIPSQCALRLAKCRPSGGARLHSAAALDWRGNPLDFQTIWVNN